MIGTEGLLLGRLRCIKILSGAFIFKGVVGSAV